MKIVGSDRRHFRPPIRAEPDRVLWQAQSTGITKNKKKGKIQMGNGLAVVAIQRFFYTLCMKIWFPYWT